MNLDILTTIGTGAAVVTLIYTFLHDLKNDLKEDISRVEKDIGKLEKDINRIDTDIKAQTKRTDQLYQMFIDLLKVQKSKTDP